MYSVLWPRGKKSTGAIASAKRLDSLEGKTIAELWNYAFRGNEFFPLLEKELTRSCPGIKFVKYDIFGSIHSGKESLVIEALPQKLTENKCDAVISGMGC